MPKASEIANELRKVIAQLEKNPDAEMKRPVLYVYAWDRDTFTAGLHLVPRPIAKRTREENFYAEHENETLSVFVCAPRKIACTLVKPAQEAVYDCLPLLSAEDEAAL